MIMILQTSKYDIILHYSHNTCIKIHTVYVTQMMMTRCYYSWWPSFWWKTFSRMYQWITDWNIEPAQCIVNACIVSNTYILMFSCLHVHASCISISACSPPCTSTCRHVCVCVLKLCLYYCLSPCRPLCVTKNGSTKDRNIPLCHFFILFIHQLLIL